MSRPVVVYLVMVVALVAGLWTVLLVGRYLSAPEDLAGKWRMQSSTAANTPGVTPAGSGAEMDIEQSGKFFQITFEHGPQLDLKLQGNSPVILSNNQWKMTIAGSDGSDDKTVQLEGPTPGTWIAHRTLRTFPSDVAAKGAQ